jgi:hypothetical protein
MFFDRTLFYNQPRIPSKVIQFVTGLTFVEVEMLICRVRRNLKRWRLKCVAQMCNLLAPHHLIWVDEKSWIQDDLPFDDPLHFCPQGVAQFSQRFSSLLSSDTANLSKHSAVASVQGSPRV